MAGNIDKNYNIYDLGLDKNLMRNDSSILPNLNKSDQSGNNFYGDKFMGGLFDPLDGTYDPQSMRSGELPSLIGHGKKKFTDTVAGLLMGVDTDKVYKWIIGDTTSSADWSVTTIGTFTIKGSIIATTGTIGGFSIGADYIRDSGNSFGLASTVTGGDDVRFWAGDTFANRATAKFNLTETGILTIGVSSAERMVLSSSDNRLHFYNSSNVETITIGQSGAPSVVLNISSPSAAPIYPIQVVQNGAASQASIYVQNEDTGTGAEGIRILQKSNQSAMFIQSTSGSSDNGLEFDYAGTGSEVIKITNTGGSNNCIFIDQSSTTNSSSCISISQSGQAQGLYINSTNNISSAACLQIANATAGRGIYVNVTYASNVNYGIYVTTAGTGKVGYFENTSSGSTNPVIEMYQGSTTSTNFRRVALFHSSTIWYSNGTDPNGNLNGTAGDICLNGASNKPAYCTGTTNWTNLV